MFVKKLVFRCVECLNYFGVVNLEQRLISDHKNGDARFPTIPLFLVYFVIRNLSGVIVRAFSLLLGFNLQKFGYVSDKGVNWLQNSDPLLLVEALSNVEVNHFCFKKVDENEKAYKGD